MAWFKDAENGSSAPAVTVERIHRALSALGFAMGPMETPAKLVAKFDGYVTVLDVSNPTFLMIRAHFPEEFPSESMGELIEKANEWNASTLWGTAVPQLQEDGSNVLLQAEVACLIDQGLNDEQLVTAVDLGLQCSLSCLDSFRPKRDEEESDGASREEAGEAPQAQDDSSAGAEG
jgi:hypothetical protein